MSPTLVDVTLWEANDATLPLTFQQSDLTAYDLTGATLTYEISAGGGALPFVTKTIGSGIAYDGAATAGKVIITIDATDTRGKAGVYTHELQIIKSGKQDTVLHGTCTIRGVIIV
jgi:hypothetical protein